MEFEWWEAKRLAVLDARRLDFLDGRRMFDGRPICTASSPRERRGTVGQRRGARQRNDRGRLDAAWFGHPHHYDEESSR
jgi:hypothetical protein